MRSDEQKKIFLAMRAEQVRLECCRLSSIGIYRTNEEEIKYQQLQQHWHKLFEKAEGMTVREWMRENPSDFCFGTMTKERTKVEWNRAQKAKQSAIMQADLDRITQANKARVAKVFPSG